MGFGAVSPELCRQMLGGPGLLHRLTAACAKRAARPLEFEIVTPRLQTNFKSKALRANRLRTVSRTPHCLAHWPGDQESNFHPPRLTNVSVLGFNSETSTRVAKPSLEVLQQKSHFSQCLAISASHSDDSIRFNPSGSGLKAWNSRAAFAVRSRSRSLCLRSFIASRIDDQASAGVESGGWDCSDWIRSSFAWLQPDTANADPNTMMTARSMGIPFTYRAGWVCMLRR